MQARAEEGKAGQGRAFQGRAEKLGLEKGMLGQGKLGQGKPGHGRNKVRGAVRVAYTHACRQCKLESAKTYWQVHGNCSQAHADRQREDDGKVQVGPHHIPLQTSQHCSCTTLQYQRAAYCGTSCTLLHAILCAVVYVCLANYDRCNNTCRTVSHQYTMLCRCVHVPD